MHPKITYRTWFTLFRYFVPLQQMTERLAFNKVVFLGKLGSLTCWTAMVGNIFVSVGFYWVKWVKKALAWKRINVHLRFIIYWRSFVTAYCQSAWTIKLSSSKHGDVFRKKIVLDFSLKSLDRYQCKS